MRIDLAKLGLAMMPVSYTHLDVYKRQMLYREAQGGMGAPEQPPADAGTRLGLRESAALAAALMVNNMGFGVRCV